MICRRCLAQMEKLNGLLLDESSCRKTENSFAAGTAWNLVKTN